MPQSASSTILTNPSPHMRTVKINGTKCEVSKSEAKEAERIRGILSMPLARDNAIYVFNRWVDSSDTDESAARRYKVGLALGICT
jgi:NADPH-dependent ferric siderophore reductase